MALFKGAVSKASPLLIQVTAPSTGPIHVMEWSAYGETGAGATSHPVIFRPSLHGTGFGVAIPWAPPGKPEAPDTTTAQAVSEVVTRFATLPSLPIVNVGSYNLPIRRKWAAPTNDQRIVVPADRAICLYARTVSPHEWSGEITWEEK